MNKKRQVQKVLLNLLCLDCLFFNWYQELFINSLSPEFNEIKKNQLTGCIS